MRERVYVVATPEALRLRFERAGLGSRALAFAIDLVAMMSLLQIAWWASSPLKLVADGFATALGIVGAFVIQWWYGALCEWRFGRTLGKRLCGLRVVGADGLPLSVAQATTRNLLRVVDLLPGFHLVGAVACLADKDGRRLGDIAAQTLVVRDGPALHPVVDRRSTLAHDADSQLRELSARLSSHERATVLQLSGTLGVLPPLLRSRLCRELFHHLAGRHAVHLSAQARGEQALSRLAALQALDAPQES